MVDIAGGSLPMIAAIKARVALALERLPAREHLVEHRAEREDVRPRIGFLPFELLGRHVLERAEDGALRGEIRRRRGHHREPSRDSRGARLGEPEIKQLRAAFRQHDVAGLQIAMRDARAMGLVQRARELNRNRQRLSRREVVARSLQPRA